MTQGTTTIASGRAALALVRKAFDLESPRWNEAETRFHLIDRIIAECLGWPREDFKLETPLGRSYSDYELGRPKRAIWEAKKVERWFELPAGTGATNPVTDLKSVMSLGGETAAAISQVQEYCANRGVDVAVATNGHQLIAFIASRSDGVAPLEGKCFVINGLEALERAFPEVWQLLSPAGVLERRLYRKLAIGDERVLPPRVRSLITGYPRYRYQSPFNASLRELGQLLLIDAVDNPSIEPKFYRECYSESGALSQHALISKQILAARYASLFPEDQSAPTVEPVKTTRIKENVKPELLTEAIAKRPIVLIGDVGVGKTSFLKHLQHVSAFDEFRNALYVYIDLGSQGALNTSLRSFVLSQIATQLREAHGVDVDEDRFVRGTYNLELKRFEKGIFGSLKLSDPLTYAGKEIEFLSSKLGDREAHLQSAVQHLSSARRKQVIVVLDNADQREYDIQQETFVIAENLAKGWHAAVFVCVRPQTFYRSKQSGAMTAYPHRLFSIAPPRVDVVLEKRLIFAAKLADGKMEIPGLPDIELNLTSISLFLRAVVESLRKNSELVEFLSNITGGNIRAVIELVANFVGSANVDCEKIISIMEESGSYVVPVHEFWKAALLGDFSFYDEKSSLALNLFDLFGPVGREHFLTPILLSYLDYDGPHKNVEGFVSTADISSELQSQGFALEAIAAACRKTNNKKLIENAQRVTFAEREGELSGDLPDMFRLSTIGAYHAKRWISEFAYLDAMSYVTPVLEDGIRAALIGSAESFAIQDRLARAEAFSSYLTSQWNASGLHPRYFNWPGARLAGQSSFDRVRAAVLRTREEWSRA